MSSGDPGQGKPFTKGQHTKMASCWSPESESPGTQKNLVHTLLKPSDRYTLLSEKSAVSMELQP